MKTKIILLSFLSFCLIACSKNTQSDNSFYQSEVLRQLVVDYGDAMNSMVAVSGNFGGDDVTYFAIDTVNAIWTNCKSQKFDFLHYMTQIAKMEYYFAYGIDYAINVFYKSMHFQEPQHGELNEYYEQNRIEFDSLSLLMQSDPTWQNYFHMHSRSLFNMALYFAFYYDVTDVPQYKPAFQSYSNYAIIDDFFSQELDNPQYYAFCIDGTSFFMTYTEYIARLSSPSPQLQEELITYANTFDSFAMPIFNALDADEPLPVLTEQDNIDFLKNILPVFTKMSNLVKTSFEAINQSQVVEQE